MGGSGDEAERVDGQGKVAGHLFSMMRRAKIWRAGGQAGE